MPLQPIESYALDKWLILPGPREAVASAINGEAVAEYGLGEMDCAAMLDHARHVGGPALRAMTVHQRAAMLKALASAIIDRKEELYALSANTGATRRDGWIDIEGGAGTLFALSSAGRRELPDGHIIPDGKLEKLSKHGSWVGQHVYTPMQGAAVHINAFNFPVWGMLEKLGPALLAGMPVIVKPAPQTSYVAEQAVRIMLDTGALPKGALQFLAGPPGDLLDHLNGQDVVSFTGSAATAASLKSRPAIIRESVRFIAEQDSLNAAVLGPDCDSDSEEFELFVKEVASEMTVKAGQKCTAIRRAFVPAALMDLAQDAIMERLSGVRMGNPSDKETTMGALVSREQRARLESNIERLEKAATRVPAGGEGPSEAPKDGAFAMPVLLRADKPDDAAAIHEIEPFGPVATLMPYRDIDHAIALARRGMGSLVMSLFTADPAIARKVTIEAASFHGRLAIINAGNAAESTGHGSPLPSLIHGGPGRAGGGEELGGVRAVKHYMQRTAIQGTPEMIAAIIGEYVAGAPRIAADEHPFRKKLSELEPGYSMTTASRKVTLEDIEHFAQFTGDNFYAHMDEEAAKASPIFGGRVAHGYLILSFAAGLFVDPDPGPVLANTGLDNLRFVKPLKPGESIQVRLTVKSISRRGPTMGQVRWSVEVTNQDDEMVATYELLTMNEG